MESDAPIVHIACQSPYCNMGGLSRSQHRRQAQLAVCSYKTPTVKQNAATVASRLWRLLFRSQYITWSDNLYRKNFAPNSHNPDRSPNCTAMAVLSLPRRLNVYPGLPSLVCLWNRRADVATALLTAQTTLLAAVQDIVASPVPSEHITCPLDVRRRKVRSLAWSPFLRHELQVGTQVDLLKLLSTIREVQLRTQHVLPLLVDEKIHYSLMKFVYYASCKEYYWRSVFSRVPVLHGVWLPYKYCCTLVY